MVGENAGHGRQCLPHRFFGPIAVAFAFGLRSRVDFAVAMTSEPRVVEDGNAEPVTEQRAPAPATTSHLHGSRWGLWALLAALVLCWLPFIDKPVHVDDPAYIWMAQQIQHRPWDFYGFSANYYGSPQRADQFFKNPPLVSYYLAGAASVFGWNERALHAAMLLTVLLAVVGTYELARRLVSSTAGAVLAAMMTAFSPVFFVCAMTIICDVLMAPLFIWAIVFWIDGVRRGSQRRLAIAATLILAAAMAKYFGAALIPLLAVYALLRWRGARWGLLWLFIPVVGIAGFEIYTHHMYGSGALGGAAAYATSSRYMSGGGRIRPLTGLSFLGGCLATAVPVGVAAVWRALRRAGRVGWVYLAIGIDLFVGLMGWQVPGIERITGLHALPPLVMGQLIVFVIAGVVVFWLMFDDLSHGLTADAVLLALGVVGTFVFIIAFNWTVSARNYLPMAPLIAVLAVRWIERQPGSAAGIRRLWFGVVTAMAPIAVVVLHADVKLAQSARDAAGMVHDFAIAAGSPKVWFQGHWGFQYYMQQWGAMPVDQVSSRCAKGDLMVIAWDNVNIQSFSSRAVRRLGRVEPLPWYWIASMHLQLMAGFHSDSFGPLPFAVGNGRPERYDIYMLEHNLIFGEPEPETPTTQQNR
jgi:hypothetical protein